MIAITSRLRTSRPDSAIEQLRLTFDLRQKTRLRTTLVTGEDAWIRLPSGEVLRGGDLLRAADGRIVEVVAEPEEVTQVTCGDFPTLARVAYHLGSRHVPMQMGAGFLRIARAPALEDLLRQLGAVTTPMVEPFEPEAGTYCGGSPLGQHGSVQDGHLHGADTAAGRHGDHHACSEHRHDHGHDHDHGHCDHHHHRGHRHE